MALFRQISKRIAYAAALLLAVVILNFLLIHIAPGDIADTIAGDMGGATAEVMAQIRIDYGLDKPFIVQLGLYLWNVLQFNFGYSFFFNTPVTALIAERLPATLLLVFTAQILALVIGIILGVISAKKPHGWLSHFVTLLALFGYSAPVFLDRHYAANWIIADGAAISGGRDGRCYPARCATMAAISGYSPSSIPASFDISINFLALYSRLCRASMLEVLGSDFIRTARAKGLSERDIIYKHALKNALSPVIILAGLQFSAVVSGAVLVETVFSWPGLGTLALQSILARDTPTILGILFFSALVVIIGNLLTDLALRFIDPRINRK